MSQAEPNPTTELTVDQLEAVTGGLSSATLSKVDSSDTIETLLPKTTSIKGAFYHT